MVTSEISNKSIPITSPIEINLPNSFFFIMKKQGKEEKELEFLKQDISIRNDITLPSLYNVFNPEGRSYVSPLDFIEGYQSFGITPNREDVYMVFNRFDKNMDGKLDYKDICHLFLPKQQEYSHIFVSRNEVINEDEKISSESLELLRTLLCKYIEVEKLNKEWKRELNGKGFRKAFEECDINGKGFFNITDVICLHNIG